RLDSEDSLETLRDLCELRATSVSICPRKKCPDCGEPFQKKHLHVVTDNCYHCGQSMKVSFLDVKNVPFSPAHFADRDIQVATRCGCLLQLRWSNTAREHYLANVCKSCGSFIGESYLHDYWILANETTAQVTGWFCLHCEKSFDG
ncbi:MAG: hypothetical protein M3347_06070, partial [Armatimonadota bacterium]|nr:hypothetical protein [Armatimonadota bacterium]